MGEGGLQLTVQRNIPRHNFELLFEKSRVNYESTKRLDFKISHWFFWGLWTMFYSFYKKPAVSTCTYIEISILLYKRRLVTDETRLILSD